MPRASDEWVHLRPESWLQLTGRVKVMIMNSNITASLQSYAGLNCSVLSTYAVLPQGRILDVLLEEGDRELRSAMLMDAFTPPEAGSSAGNEVLRFA